MWNKPFLWKSSYNQYIAKHTVYYLMYAFPKLSLAVFQHPFIHLGGKGKSCLQNFNTVTTAKTDLEYSLSYLKC